MGKTGRDGGQIYSIDGVEDWQTPVFLWIHAIFFSSLSVLFLVYFEPICEFFQYFLPGPSSARFTAGFTSSFTALSAVCLFYAAGNLFYSSVSLHWEMAQRMVNAVNDESSVKHALDLGCGRGILLNAVALQLQKSGSSGYTRQQPDHGPLSEQRGWKVYRSMLLADRGTLENFRSVIIPSTWWRLCIR